MSMMLNEVQAIPDVLRRMLDDDAAVLDLAARWAVDQPGLFVSVARGSSAHAAEYFHHAAMRQLGIASFAVPLSLVSLTSAPLQLANACALGFSQSGKSPDLVDSLRYLKQRGARTTAIVNTPDSALAAVADNAILLPAGNEVSVAATKSCVAMMMASIQSIAFLSHHRGHGKALLEALAQLPDQMSAALDLDWSAAVELLLNADTAMLVGRGGALPMAREAALKLQETCAIQTACYSSAEVRHGPMEIIAPGYPLVVFAPNGPEQGETLLFAQAMRERGAKVLVIGPAKTEGVDLPYVTTQHPLLEPFTLIQSFYGVAEALAIARGRNPDQPQFLQKVTETR